MTKNLRFNLIILLLMLSFAGITQSKKELRQIIKTEDTLKLQTFIDNGFDVNSLYSKNTYFLNQAILHEKLTLTKFILKQENVQIQRVEKDGFTTLHYVVFNGWYDVAKDLIERGVDLNTLEYKDSHILTTIMINYQWKSNADSSSLNFIKYLYSNGLDTNLTKYCCSGHKTPLMLGAIAADIPTMEYLILQQHNSINLVGFKNRTALHYAVFNNRIDVVKLLIENGADLNVKDDKGRTPLDYAIKKKNEDLIQILEIANSENSKR